MQRSLRSIASRRTIALFPVERQVGQQSSSHLLSYYRSVNRESQDKSFTYSPIRVVHFSTAASDDKKEEYHSSANVCHVEDAPEDSTFRQRMDERRIKGAKAARKGAKSFSNMVQQYGPVFIGTYFSVYFTTLGSLFLGVESGVLDPAYIMSLVAEEGETTKSTVSIVSEFLEHYSWTAPYASKVQENPQMANLAVAWIATKFTEPLRLAFTGAITPRLARKFGYVVKELDPETMLDNEHDATSRRKRNF